jgi:hypothetical protein
MTRAGLFLSVEEWAAEILSRLQQVETNVVPTIQIGHKPIHASRRYIRDSRTAISDRPMLVTLAKPREAAAMRLISSSIPS